MLNVELFSAKACDCELVNCELKPSAMLSVELSAKPMLNYARCAMLNVEC